MINNVTQRSLLRWIHIICGIPILSYIYGPISEVQTYATPVRLVFVPVIILSGFWMYIGAVFALIGVVLWLGACYFSGFWAAVLSQVVLFIARKTWLGIRARRSK